MNIRIRLKSINQTETYDWTWNRALAWILSRSELKITKTTQMRFKKKKRNCKENPNSSVFEPPTENMENLKNVSNDQKPFLCNLFAQFLCKTGKNAKKSLTNFKWAEKGEEKNSNEQLQWNFRHKMLCLKWSWKCCRYFCSVIVPKELFIFSVFLINFFPRFYCIFSSFCIEICCIVGAN